jgi:hypothetical protein
MILVKDIRIAEHSQWEMILVKDIRIAGAFFEARNDHVHAC